MRNEPLDITGKVIKKGDIILKATSYGTLDFYKVIDIIYTSHGQPNFGNRLRLVAWDKWKINKKLKGRSIIHYKAGCFIYWDSKSQKIYEILKD